MKECVQPFYIKDGKILDCQSFDSGLINEGKSVYEVARLSGIQLLFIEDHLDRLFLSLELAGIKPWISREYIAGHLEELISKNQALEGNVKIVMNFRKAGDQHFLAYFVAHHYPSKEDYTQGVRVITFQFERLEPNKKIWRPAFRREVAEILQKSGAFEALLLDSQETLTEASKANIFAIRGDEIITPPGEVILPGITRKYVLEACREMDIPVVKRKISMNELRNLDGLFLSGTSIHVLPVCRVNDIVLPSGNPMMKKLMKHLEQIIHMHLRLT